MNDREIMQKEIAIALEQWQDLRFDLLNLPLNQEPVTNALEQQFPEGTPQHFLNREVANELRCLAKIEIELSQLKQQMGADTPCREYPN